MKKILAFMLALIVVLTTLVGCGGKKTSGISGNVTDVAFKVNEEAEKVSDSSELPDWTGEKIDLTMWYATGSYSAKKNEVSSDDVVTPEIYRVTGVKFAEDSFDNNGDTMDAKISKVIATGEWPDIIWGGQHNVLNQLIEEDMLWDLTDLIPKYMPNIHKLMQKGDFMKSKRDDGKIFEIDMAAPVDYMYPDMDPNLLARTSVPKSKTSYVLVRDDILKKLKPEAYTQDELVAKFEANGGFTQDEILNASFNSKDEFIQFLRDVKELGVKVGDREVYPTYAFTGSDNWDFLTVLAGALNGFNCFPSGVDNNYFTYFDVESGKIEYMFEQEWYKEIVKELTELIQEDVISKDSIIDNTASFHEKCANGEYAVLYGGTIPDVNTLNENANGYKYRKVTLNIPYNGDKFIPIYSQFSTGGGYAFVKSEISETEIAQVLRAFDFMLTDVGQKLVMWGPKSAGLFEETENGRRFVNKDIENEAVYGISTGSLLKYGLRNKHWPGYPSGTNRWDPMYIYDFVPNISRLNYFYSTGVYDPIETVQSIYPRVYNNFPTYIPETEKFWDARTAWENKMTKVLTAENASQFEDLWQVMVAEARRNGLTEDTLTKVNDVWVNTINKDYMDNIEDYLKAHNSKLNVERK